VTTSTGPVEISAEPVRTAGVPTRSGRPRSGRPRPALLPQLRLVAGALILGLLVLRFGADPVVRGLRAADGRLLALGLVLNAVATACCAWRWRAVAAALEARIGFGPAYLSCFGAQFLNGTLPAGVLGDVQRALEHGQRVESRGRAARSVLWERTLGLATQVVVTVGLVGTVSTGLRPAALVAGVFAVGLAAVALCWRPVRSDLVAILRRPSTAAIVVSTSLGVAACHAVVLVAVMATAGVDLPPAQTAALALAVLLGSTVPTSIAGWGPREGTAAAAFAAVGLSAADGLSVSVTYGVVALVATLPGAVALAATRLAPARETRVG